MKTSSPIGLGIVMRLRMLFSGSPRLFHTCRAPGLDSRRVGLQDAEKGTEFQESGAEGGQLFQGSQAEINASWQGRVFSVWLSGLITARPIGLAAASPPSVRQSQAAGYGVFPLDRRSCAAWLIPSIGPKRALGLERP